MKRFFKTFVALSISALMLMSCASAATTAYHYPEAKLVIVSGTTDKADVRKPVTLSLEDSYGSLYTAQMRAYNSEFEFRIPVELIYELSEYTLKLNINGKYSEESLTVGDKFTVNTSWNAVEKELTIFGVSVYKGYTTDEVSVSVVDTKDGDNEVYSDVVEANSLFAYSISVPFDDLGLGFSIYEITVSTPKDSETITFNYTNIDGIIDSTKEESNTAEDIQNILVNNKAILDMSTWTAVDGSEIDELSVDVFEILMTEIQDIDNTDQLKLAINKAVFVDHINKAISGEDVLDIVDNYSGTFFDIEKITAYDPLYKSYKNVKDKCEALDGLAGYGLEAFADVEKAFNDTIILYGINSAKQWSNIQKVALDYKTYLGFDGELSQDVCVELFNDKESKEFEDIDSFVETAKGYIEDEEDEEDEEEVNNKKNNRPSYPSTKVTNNNAPIVVTPIEQPVIFDDIADVAWANYEITELYKKGIINGVADKKFDPNAPVTREQFVKMLMLAFNITENGKENATFTDVDFREWFAPYVKLAASNGIVTGKGDGSFGVGEAITRQDAATLIYRLITVAEGEEISGLAFADEAAIADYAKEAVTYLSGKNVINGVGNGNFEPMSVCTRAQAAKIIYQVLAVK